MALIEVIEYEQSEDRLREIYDDLIQKRGKLASVHKIQSLHPESIVRHMDLYLTIMFSQSPLPRVQREMMAVVVSVVNQCTYCARHHAEAVHHYWKDETKLKQLETDYRQLDLNEKEEALCCFAEALTLHPSGDQQARIDRLKAVGFSDRAILDATLVTSYFNFVNRIVLSLGVDLEADGGKGFDY